MEIGAGEGETGTVVAEGQALHPADVVPFESGILVTGFCFPYSHAEFVCCASGNQLAVGTDGHLQDASRVAAQQVGALAGVDVPQNDFARDEAIVRVHRLVIELMAAGRQPLAVRMERQTVHHPGHNQRRAGLLDARLRSGQ